MKRVKKSLFFSIFISFAFVLLFLNLSFVSADFDLGKSAGQIEKFYSKGDELRGWINISLDEESINSSLTSYQSNITLIEFLNRNEAEFNCTPEDCEISYKASNPENTKSFNLASYQSKIIGIKLTGKLREEPVKSVSFNVNSNAEASCNQPLQIDLLNDNEIEWESITADNNASNFLCSDSYGCYKTSGAYELFHISTEEYCEKITLPANPSFEIGADIIKGDTTNPNLKMKVYDESFEKLGECSLPEITYSGKFGCKINTKIDEQKDVYVCIDSDKSTNYQIKGKENNESCGFFGIDNFNEFTTDYSIFAKGGTFAPLSSFKFDENSYKNYEAAVEENELADYINDYLSNKYGNDCEKGCVIPIKFISGKNQEINISGLIFEYSSVSGNKTNSEFYSVEEESPKISSNFLVLNLDYADFIVNVNSGTSSAEIELNGDRIIRESISISGLPSVIGVEPTDPPALVPVVFKVILEKEISNLTYTWDFGNGNIITTDKGIITHTLNEIGPANVTIGISKSGSNQTKKSFNLNVIAPKDAINSTIKDYEKDLNELKSELNKLPEWMKTEIDKSIKVEDYEAELKAQVKKYDNGFGLDDTRSLEIMNSLVRMEIPNNFFTSNRISNVPLIQSEEALDLDVLSDLGSGNVEFSKEEYYKSINSWIANNLDVKLSSDIYTVDFQNSERKETFSYIKLVINPKKEDVDEFYFAINGDPNFIKFKEDIGGRDIGASAYGVYITDLKESKTIEILYPERIDFLNLPLYISPAFESLTLEPEFIVYCRIDGKCDKDGGESYQNCSADCSKPWFSTIILLLIWFITAFIIYILMYAWYKNRYESYLFKDKRQLFNLLNFMFNAQKRGISKDSIINILRKGGWNNEQIIYSWNKLNGKRTGMFEIPIFSLLQRKGIQKKIETEKVINKPDNNSNRNSF